ncbi:MAG: beta-ketoacyl-[acyl-carrier-protein] synthase family protein [bacterium]
MKRRVVITGVGVISPNGIGKERFWKATICGKSGVERITSFDTSEFKSKIAAEVKDFDPRRLGLREEQIRRMDRYVQFSVAGTKMAVEDSMLNMSAVNKERVGVSIANAICGTKFMEEEFLIVTERGKEPINPEYVSPYLYQASMFNTPSNEISSLYSICGICNTISTGCTAGVDAVGFSCETILNDEADIMIAGASEAPITPIALAAFDVIGAISKNDEPSRASRPFDRDRDGFILGEGCGILILEELKHALDRGVHIYAEIIGYGTTCNAFHMTDLSPDGIDLARAIKLAIKHAGIKPEEIDYINAHGSSTEQNDRNETSALKISLGDHAYHVPISSIKSMIGHPLSAANSIELIACSLIIENNLMPPTINYENPDPDCDLDYIPNKAREGKVDVVLKNSSGFSGIHSALLLRRYS